MNTTIYDANEARPARRSSGLLTLALGIGLSAWYVVNIGKTVRGDIQTFPSSFKSLPFLTTVFAAFKVVAYIAFGMLFLAMIYVPLRNLWPTKSWTGRFQVVEERSGRFRGRHISIRLGDKTFRLKNADGLKSVLDEKISPGDLARFTIGAFGRVERVEKLEGNSPHV